MDSFLYGKITDGNIQLLDKLLDYDLNINIIIFNNLKTVIYDDKMYPCYRIFQNI